VRAPMPGKGLLLVHNAGEKGTRNIGGRGAGTLTSSTQSSR